MKSNDRGDRTLIGQEPNAGMEKHQGADSFLERWAHNYELKNPGSEDQSDQGYGCKLFDAKRLTLVDMVLWQWS
jgi:hypothetical protein